MTLRKPWAIALIVGFTLSLVVNFFVTGALVATWRFAGAHPTGMSAMQEFRDRIPRDARPVFRDAFHDNRERLRPAFRAMGEARAELETAVHAEPFDRAAVSRAFDNVQARSVEAQELVHEILIEAVESLPPDVRQEIDLSPRGRNWIDPMGFAPAKPPRREDFDD